MSRLASLITIGLVAVSGPAVAQYYGHSPSGGHYHVTPGHYHQHGNHYDYHPGQTIYHPNSTPSYSPQSSYYPQSSYVPSYTQPSYTQPSYTQPSYTQPSYTQPSYADDYDGHPYDHQSGAHTTGYRGTFGGFTHIDDLAVQLEQEANLMCLEMHYNYQHNPGFRETYREAYEILTTAKYIHGLEHAGNRDRIRQAVTELDPLFHHVQDDVRHWTRHQHRYLGQSGLTAKMAAVEETLHHLMNDVGATSQFEAGDVAPGPQIGP